jgi:hypothetical protein
MLQCIISFVSNPSTLINPSNVVLDVYTTIISGKEEVLHNLFNRYFSEESTLVYETFIVILNLSNPNFHTVHYDKYLVSVLNNNHREDIDKYIGAIIVHSGNRAFQRLMYALMNEYHKKRRTNILTKRESESKYIATKNDIVKQIRTELENDVNKHKAIKNNIANLKYPEFNYPINPFGQKYKEDEINTLMQSKNDNVFDIADDRQTNEEITARVFNPDRMQKMADMYGTNEQKENYLDIYDEVKHTGGKHKIKTRRQKKKKT